MLSHYLKEIADREFTERNREIPRMVARILQEMNSRGIMYSTMTLDAVADFFVDEFSGRCDFIKNFIVSHPALLMADGMQDPITAAKIAYQDRSCQEREEVVSLYDSSSRTVSQSLKNEAVKNQIRQRLCGSMVDRIDKNNLYVEVAYREISMVKGADSNVLILRPNFAGVGIDLKELYRRHLEPLLRRKQKGQI